MKFGSILQGTREGNASDLLVMVVSLPHGGSHIPVLIIRLDASARSPTYWAKDEIRRVAVDDLWRFEEIE